MASTDASDTSRNVKNSEDNKSCQPDSKDTKEIRKFCEYLMKIDGSSHTNVPPSVYEERCRQIMTQWEPKFPTIALYVRWAKHSGRDYNTDSISLLNTLADQAGLTPLRFLKDVSFYRWCSMHAHPIRDRNFH
eukprot:scaffold16891_cov70-Cylindrotheca_fusiformis.AAC.1